MNFDIDTAGVIRLADAFGANIKQMRRAETRALNKSIKWGVGKIAREVGKEVKIPAKLIKQRVRGFKATRRKARARIYAGLNAIKAKRLGKVRQLKKGVRAGRHTFKGAFVTATSNAHTGIFERTGEKKRTMKSGSYAGKNVKREPIREVELDINTQSVTAIIDKWFGRIQERFFEIFKRELKYEVFVKANA